MGKGYIGSAIRLLTPALVNPPHTFQPKYQVNPRSPISRTIKNTGRGHHVPDDAVVVEQVENAAVAEAGPQRLPQLRQHRVGLAQVRHGDAREDRHEGEGVPDHGRDASVQATNRQAGGKVLPLVASTASTTSKKNPRLHDS